MRGVESAGGREQHGSVWGSSSGSSVRPQLTQESDRRRSSPCSSSRPPYLRCTPPPPAPPSPALAAAHTAAHTAARPPPPQSASTVYKVGACLFIFFQLVRAAQPALPKRERETRAPF